jgi:succinyl-CoA synthetase beta subunit
MAAPGPLGQAFDSLRGAAVMAQGRYCGAVRSQEAPVDLFEYQGKQYFARFGIPVSPGGVVTTPDEAVALSDQLGYPVVIKAQVQVGGRGKAGGIKLAANADEARVHASAILGMDIRGHVVHVVWIERASDIAKEYYASFTLDRGAKAHLAMVSAQGGVEIEQVAEEDPGAIARLHVDPYLGFSEAQARRLVDEAGLDDEAKDGAVSVLLSLYRCFVEGDADLVEVNPLVLTPDGRVHALDAKVTLDDNAAFRHPEWEEFAGTFELDEREQFAQRVGLQYVGLDGYVGIIANGAGLAMSTCDVVNQVGGRPANFLDIGGGASAEVMANALEVISSDPSVRSIFINIFGGITRGEDVANGIVTALGRVDIKVPMVIRLDGTNAEQGREILSTVESDLVITSPAMLDAARLAVSLAGAEK